MATNPPSLHQDASAAMAAATTQPDHVSLRVITLVHGSDGAADLYLVLSLNCRVGQLKESLQQHLGQHPQPDHQRLIYQGRPLLDNNATLRSILRLDPSTNPPPVHVLHLVIREQQPSLSNASPGRPQTAQAGPPLSNIPPTHQAGQRPMPPNLPQAGLPGMAAAQQMIQNQINAVQHHMAIHQQHLANTHPGLPQAHLRGTMPFPGMPGAGPGILQSGTQARTLPGTPHMETRPDSPGPLPVTNGMPQITHANMTTRVQEVIGPNGERIRTVINTRGPFPSNNLTPPQANPVERPASAPGSAQGSEPSVPTAAAAGQESTGTLPPIPPPIPMFPGHFARTMMTPIGMPFPQLQPQPSSNPTVWLLSSSTGPQAILFAPDHGYFSTTPSTQAMSNEASQSSSTTSPPPQVNNNPGPIRPLTQGVQANNGINPPRADIILRPEQGQNQPQAAARPQQREVEDVLAFLLQRGWLFLRLYMFIYVLSEAGTWRRMILLSIAVFVCLLPRQNPLTDAFNVVRRHVDNLIGPPQAPQRQAPVQRPGQDPNANTRHNTPAASTNDTARGTQPMPTPEEHARRLLREHQEQNPSVIRGILHSVEQAVALFLASLIPGVGERHVRAREEARRIVQEEERRLREAEASNAQPMTEQPTPISAGSSTESGSNAAPGTEEEKRPGAAIPSSNGSESQIPAGISTGIEPSPTIPSTSAAPQADAEGVRRRVDASAASSSGQVV